LLLWRIRYYALYIRKAWSNFKHPCHRSEMIILKLFILDTRSILERTICHRRWVRWTGGMRAVLQWCCCKMSPLIKTKQWGQTGVCMSVFDNEFYFPYPPPTMGASFNFPKIIFLAPSLQHVNNIINYGTKLLNSCNSNWY